MPSLEYLCNAVVPNIRIPVPSFFLYFHVYYCLWNKACMKMKLRTSCNAFRTSLKKQRKVLTCLFEVDVKVDFFSGASQQTHLTYTTYIDLCALEVANKHGSWPSITLKLLRRWLWLLRQVYYFLCVQQTYKHCQRHYRPRRWLLWPVILVWWVWFSMLGRLCLICFGRVG